MSFGPTTIDHTSFISNTSSDWGGGAYLASFATGTETQLTSVQFLSNTPSKAWRRVICLVYHHAEHGRFY